MYTRYRSSALRFLPDAGYTVAEPPFPHAERNPMPFIRPSGRAADALREVRFQLNAAPFAEGSCLTDFGATRVLCTATVEPGVPPFREGRGGWVTAEYSMLPRATLQRTRRERNGARGRTQEIQRLIGRCLRAAVDLEALGEHTITVDCDVLAADGGTRTASITGACLALESALDWLVASGAIESSPLLHRIAAISVGVVEGTACLDLEYVEDAGADVDLNVAALDDGRIVEIQGTAEGTAFGRRDLNELVDLAEKGISELVGLQAEASARN